MGKITPEEAALLASALRRTAALIEPEIPARLRPVVSARDLAQDAVLAYLSRPGSRAFTSPDHLRDWLLRAARSALVTRVRRARCTKRGGRLRILRFWTRRSARPDLLSALRAPTKTPSADSRLKEALERLNRSMAALSPQRQNVLVRCSLEGHAVPDVARDLGLSESAIYSLLFHAKRELRDKLGKPEDVLP